MTVMLLVGAFSGGWMSHKRWGQLELESALTSALTKARGTNPGIRVENIDGLPIINTTPPKEQSEAFMELLRLMQEHAKK
jgi:hypothetical protein